MDTNDVISIPFTRDLFIQDLLVPIGLGIVDSRLCQWVSNVYRCSSKNVDEKLPHGKYSHNINNY